MLQELSHYENIGSPEVFYTLFKKINNSKKKWTVNDVEEFFYNRIIGGASIFDGCLEFANTIGLLSVNKQRIISLNSLVNKKELPHKEKLKELLVDRTLKTFKDDEDFIEIFDSRFLSFDIGNDVIEIEMSAFTFKYANFRDFLLSVEFILSHPNKNIHKFIINSKYKSDFDEMVLPAVKARKVSIEEIKQAQELKEKYGLEAEEYVVAYEKERLEGHPGLSEIKRISDYHADAGYDVLSYENIDSRSLDRHIEVKSFSGVPSFYWSRNEIDIARIEKGQYFLYLINRDLMNKEEYEPIIIKNPYENVIQQKEGWISSVQSYFIIKKS